MENVYKYRMIEPKAINGEYHVGEFYADGRFRHAYAGEISGSLMWLRPIETSMENRVKVFKKKFVSVFEVEPYRKG